MAAQKAQNMFKFIPQVQDMLLPPTFQILKNDVSAGRELFALTYCSFPALRLWGDEAGEEMSAGDQTCVLFHSFVIMKAPGQNLFMFLVML